MTERAIALQEILENVISQSDDPPTLAKCTRVNHRWHAAAVSGLWHGSCGHLLVDQRFATPGVGVLQSLARRDPDRFRYYIGFVRYFSLYERDEPSGRRVPDDEALWDPELWRGLRAQYVDVDIGSERMSHARMECLLGPSLTVLSFFGWSYSVSSLNMIKTRCPSLRALLLDKCNENAIYSSALVDFFQDMSQLTHIELAQSWGIHFTQPVVESILKRPNLELLKLGDSSYSPVTANNVTLLLGNPPKPPTTSSQAFFKHLRCLMLWSVEDPAIRFVLIHAPHLQNVDLTINQEELDAMRDVFIPLSSCSGLVEVSIHLDGAGNPIKSELLILAKNCPLLRELCIDWDHADHMMPNLTILESLIENLPEIRKLDLGIPWSERQPADGLFQQIPTYCPFLRFLRLEISIDILAPAEVLPEPKFLHLEDLEVTQIVRGHDIDAKPSDRDIKKLVDRFEAVTTRRMPRLRSVYIQCPTDDPKERFLKQLLKRLDNRAVESEFHPAEDEDVSTALMRKLLEEP